MIHGRAPTSDLGHSRGSRAMTCDPPPRHRHGLLARARKACRRPISGAWACKDQQFLGRSVKTRE